MPKNDSRTHEIGTDEYREYLQQNTPCQEVEEYVREAQKNQTDKKKKHFSQVFDNPLKGFPYNEEFTVREINEEDDGLPEMSDVEDRLNELEALDKMQKTHQEDADKSLAKKAEKSGVSVATLRKVYNRGVAAWKTGHRPGTTPEQWGHARVNAFLVKRKKGNLNHDTDLA